MKNTMKLSLQHNRTFWSGEIIAEKVIGRYRGETSMFDPKDITYMDVSPKQSFLCDIYNPFPRT
jgi:DNA-directed RNA polymerase beta subunit